MRRLLRIRSGAQLMRQLGGSGCGGVIDGIGVSQSTPGSLRVATDIEDELIHAFVTSGMRLALPRGACVMITAHRLFSLRDPTVPTSVRRYVSARDALQRSVAARHDGVFAEVAAAMDRETYSVVARRLLGRRTRRLNLVNRVATAAGLAVCVGQFLFDDARDDVSAIRATGTRYIASAASVACAVARVVGCEHGPLVDAVVMEYAPLAEEYVALRAKQAELDARGIIWRGLDVRLGLARSEIVGAAAMLAEILTLETDYLAHS